jgi:hypothetical protein
MSVTEISKAADALEQEREEPAEPAADGKIFDDSAYEREDLAIPKVDGEGIDKIRITFSGNVMLDRSNPADVALFNRARLSQELELRCSGKVSAVTTGFTTSKDGDLDAVVGGKTIKVESVWILDPEDL